MTLMRWMDQEECRAAGLEPEEALEQSRAASDASFRTKLAGEPVAEWGYRSITASTAQVWMLSFEAASSHRVTFARESLRMLDVMLNNFTSLRADVWAGHVVSRRWLEWLGFRPIADTYYNGELFIIMQKDRD